MKLLLDQHLSHKLAARLTDLYPDSEHVRNIGLQSASDEAIWDYAKKHAFAIVTKDEDFHIRSVLEGPPPKILWIRSGNCSTEIVETLLRKNSSQIERFQTQPTIGFLTLL